MTTATSSGRPFALGYRPALDGVRGLAIAVVVLGHLYPGLLPGFRQGVTVFFVLSGFLITSLLCTEFTRASTVDLGAFYIRRALRLVPALVLVTATAGGLAVWTLGAGTKGLVTEATAALTYTYDYVAALRPEGSTYLWMGQTWSLAIEEQFYLLWPFALVGLLRWSVDLRMKLMILAGLILAITAWRTALMASRPNSSWPFITFDCRLDSLLVGCLLALLFSWGEIRAEVTPKLVSTLGWLSIGALAFCASVDVVFGPVGTSLVFLLASAASAGLIAVCVWGPGNQICTIFERRPLRWLGRISYGLYLWHYAFLATLGAVWPWAVSGSGMGPQVYRASMLALSLTTAALSYHLVERPFLRRKASWGSSSRPNDVPVGPELRPEAVKAG